MLVLSRRESETIVFPALNTKVEVLKVRGNVVRIGIEAPRNLQVLRGELAEEAAPTKVIAFGEASDEETAKAEAEQRHAIRNQLNVATLGLKLIKKQLDLGRVDSARETLESIVGKFMEANAKRRADQPAPPPLSAPGRKPQALLVDDDQNELQLLAALLRNNGIEVATAKHGGEAIDQLNQGLIPDVILLDMMMPDFDGPSTVRAIRANPSHVALKIFAVSGAEREQLGLICGPGGVDRWFEKPLDTDRLFFALSNELTAA